ncbi:MAG: cytidine deaminase [Acidiferrobacterales bacterium]
MSTVCEKDLALIEEAREIIARRFRQNYHHVGAALRTRSGKVFRGVHLEATVGRVAVCAEATAMGVAATEGDMDVEMIVAVDREGGIISPCGLCRELISDYAPDCEVIVPGNNGPEVVSIQKLIPRKYRKRQRKDPK